MIGVADRAETKNTKTKANKQYAFIIAKSHDKSQLDYDYGSDCQGFDDKDMIGNNNNVMNKIGEDVDKLKEKVDTVEKYTEKVLSFMKDIQKNKQSKKRILKEEKELEKRKQELYENSCRYRKYRGMRDLSVVVGKRKKSMGSAYSLGSGRGGEAVRFDDD